MKKDFLKWILITVLLLSIFALLATAKSSLPTPTIANYTTQPKILTPEFGIMMATFLAVLVALFGESFREWHKRPKISLRFDKKSDRCFKKAGVVEDLLRFESKLKGSYNTERCFYRLEIENKGGRAKNVKVKIDLLDSKEKEIQYFEPSTLRWISGREYEDLTKGEVNYVNICSQIVRVVSPKNIDARKLENLLRIELSDLTYLQSPASYLGYERGRYDLPLDNYIFKIVVCGDNFKSIPKKFKFTKPLTHGQTGDLILLNQSYK